MHTKPYGRGWNNNVIHFLNKVFVIIQTLKGSKRAENDSHTMWVVVLYKGCERIKLLASNSQESLNSVNARIIISMPDSVFERVTVVKTRLMVRRLRAYK